MKTHNNFNLWRARGMFGGSISRAEAVLLWVQQSQHHPFLFLLLNGSTIKCGRVSEKGFFWVYKSISTRLCVTCSSLWALAYQGFANNVHPMLWALLAAGIWAGFSLPSLGLEFFVMSRCNFVFVWFFSYKETGGGNMAMIYSFNNYLLNNLMPGCRVHGHLITRVSGTTPCESSLLQFPCNYHMLTLGGSRHICILRGACSFCLCLRWDFDFKLIVTDLWGGLLLNILFTYF